MLGVDPARADRAWRERIGIVLQQCRMRPELTVRETLELYAGYYRAPRGVDETIDHVGLERQGRRPRRQPLRRPAAPARRRRRADRRPRAALPRRADDRLRPLRPPPGLGRDRRACASSARRSSSPPTTWTRRSALADRVAIIAARPDRRRRAARTSSATASSRPATISFRLPAGVAAGELPAELGADGRERRRRFVARDRRPGRRPAPAHRLGARARARARGPRGRAARASRTSTSSSPRGERRRRE